MKQKLTACGIGLILLFIFYSCQKEISGKAGESKNGKAKNTTITQTTECGTPLTKDLLDQGGVTIPGNLVVSNDANFITLKASSNTAGVNVTKIIAVYGSQTFVQNALSVNPIWQACDGPAVTNRVKNVPSLASDTIKIPNSEFQADNCIWIGAFVTFRNAGGFEWCTYASPSDFQVGSAQWQSAFRYCRQDCPPGDCGQLRTQTPGGWGAPPNGNNPGMYLHANFGAAFPNGLAIGCYPGDFYVRFTSAQAITDYMPAGGEPSVLAQSFTNPATENLKNTLVDHVIAATLSTGFDVYDPNFGQAGINLGQMVIKSGTFQGWTVNQVLAEANKVLGGCGGSYSAKELNDALGKVNENYVDGKGDKGFLVCPVPTER